MKPSFDNKVMSSFVLWFNHVLLNKGEAYQNTSSYFYPTNQRFNGLYSYALPYNQIVSDFSITGAQVPTGVYLNNFFVTTGVSGFHGIDYERGRAYFTTPVPAGVTISGRCSVKEFNVKMITEPEVSILFETEYSLRPKIGQSPTGLLSNELTYPVIFLTNNAGQNVPFAFGGQDSTMIEASALVLADSKFNLDAICALFRDQSKTIINLLEESDYPYNIYGEFKSNLYNYTGLASGKDYFFLDNVSIGKTTNIINNDIKSINPNIFFGIIDFELRKERYPRA